MEDYADVFVLSASPRMLRRSSRVPVWVWVLQFVASPLLLAAALLDVCAKEHSLLCAAFELSLPALLIVDTLWNYSKRVGAYFEERWAFDEMLSVRLWRSALST